MPTSTSPAPPSTTARAPTGDLPRTASAAEPSRASLRSPSPRSPTSPAGAPCLEPVRDGLQLGRLHRRQRQPKLHRPKRRRHDERQRALHAQPGFDRSQRPDALARGRARLHLHVRLADGGRRFRLGLGPRYLLAPLRRELGHPCNGSCGAFTGRGRRSPTRIRRCHRRLLPLPLLDRRHVGNRSATVTASVDARSTPRRRRPPRSRWPSPPMPTSTSPAPPSTTARRQRGHLPRHRLGRRARRIASVRRPHDRNVTGGGMDASSPYEPGYTSGRLDRAPAAPKVHRPKQRRHDERHGPFTLSQDGSVPSTTTTPPPSAPAGRSIRS